ncbi:hypothetical protein H9N25_17440 [Pedobacter riviphilus]|uniref:Bacteriocin-type signal sequence-containing protein n=1 Tax=Pedobacter riviphilus TaxID=2766984 RepID=A0ABX6TFI6_9SPHI|nr:hypothetical protein [Pedobacter riviphilus]QNR83711.1 hypothetical protein H9N25_17440 [Pedobacter riviphilus]
MKNLKPLTRSELKEVIGGNTPPLTAIDLLMVDCFVGCMNATEDATVREICYSLCRNTPPY